MLILFAMLPKISSAWSDAIWPFNTPYSVAGQICTNAGSLANYVTENKKYNTRRGILAELQSQERSRLAADPLYQEWTKIYYNRMRQYVELVWQNPDIGPEMAEELVEERCNGSKEYLIKSLARTNPK